MDKEILEKFGPLRPLAGIWEGSPGNDDAPAPDRQKERNVYRERMVLEPLNPVSNHEQKLYVLRYSSQVFRIEEKDPFHEEVGYWLWDPKEKQLTRAIAIPRGMVALAGGHAEPDSKHFKLKAELGSSTFGICSNPFLDDQFQTVKYEVDMKINEDGTFTYDQNTYIKIKGQPKLFEHRDTNTLHKIG